VARFQPRLWSILTAAVVLVGLTYNLDGYPLLDPDEGRNAEVAREMAESNDYVLPRLNGLPYVDKPVLYFGVGAAFMEVLGPTTLAARLPSLLFTLGTLTLLVWLGRRMLGPEGGWIAAVATAAMPLTLAFARTVIFDSTLTFFMVLSLLSFYQAIEAYADASGPSATREAYGWWIAGAWAAMALGVLTKGPIAIALPLMVIVPYSLWRRRLAAVVDSVALLLFIALVLPWVLAMSREVPGFLDHALVTETFKRLTTDELRRTGPFWYFFPIVFAGALPWSLVAVSGWRKGAARDHGAQLDQRVVFLAVWVVVPLLFFTFSQSKRPQYVLPLMPPIGLLVAYLWTRFPDRLPGRHVAAVGLAASGFAVLAAPLIVPALLDVHSEVGATIPRTGVFLGLAGILAGAGTWYARTRPAALLALSVPAAAIPLSSTRLMSAIGHDRSSETVAAAIEQVMSESTEIVAIRTYPLSLPFYLRRTLTLATDDGRELTSNYLIDTYDRWAASAGSPFRDVDWWFDAMLRCERPRVFLVSPSDTDVRDLLAERMNLLAEGRKVAAYGPCSAMGLARDPDRGK